MHQVSVANFAFSPQNVNAVPGDTLRWVWVNGIHTATSGDPSTCTPDGIFNGPVDSGHHTFDYCRDSGGHHLYFCVFHCAMGMNGSITVSEPVAVPEDPRRSRRARAGSPPRPTRSSPRRR